MTNLDYVSQFNFIDETQCIINLAQQINELNWHNIENHTLKTVTKLKKQQKLSLLEKLILKFGINTAEGLAVMELAEALLRVPDLYTSSQLLQDKLSHKKEWSKYKSSEDEFLIKKLIDGLSLSAIFLKKNHNFFSDIFNKNISIPIINKSARLAVKKIGQQFIMGEDIESALNNSNKYKKYLFSYDILGEGARSQEQAQTYFTNYLQAIEKIGPNINKDTPQEKRVSLSVKLSALHPKYEYTNLENVIQELIPKLEQILTKASQYGINITIDAEECARLPISLIIFEKLFLNPNFKDYSGFGLAVQAYNKSAMHVLNFLSQLANSVKKKIPVRLVKGAYWDGEIKKAQMLGLPNFHVFTQKYHTDVSYLACAKYMLAQQYFYPQFATHNAFTVNAILEIAKDKDFEFQRLHGMGNDLHNLIMQEHKVHCRIYAPIGPYQDLLAYLIRRILENGASNSFVHLLAAGKSLDQQSLEKLVENPLKIAHANEFKANAKIIQPLYIYKNYLNSSGIDMGNTKQLQEFSENLKKFTDHKWFACPIIEGKEFKEADADLLHCPGLYEKISGKVINTKIEQCQQALQALHKFFHSEWKNSELSNRIKIANTMADLLEKNKYELSALLMFEVGKTPADCEGEIREAVDFCRYYAMQAERLIGSKISLQSHHIGELNELSLHPKGVFVCISPWNFPLAIFLGQIIASLLCGNVVAIKPSEQTPLIGYYAIKLLFEAGLPQNALAFLPGSGEIVGKTLTESKLISGVCFTGSTQTAKIIAQTVDQHNPAIIPIIAETGGQNAMIVDSTALPEQTIDDIIISAFGSTGQRCSALRVLYLQEEIADKFLELLQQATNTKKIGFAFEDFSVDFGPVIDHDAWQNLHAHLQKMKDKIIYAYPFPSELNAKGFYIAPHIIKINHINELESEVFGPILHVITYKANEIEQVIEQINSTGFGLTFGIQTRIENKFEEIAQKINAGNIYVNRSMIGAVVGVQPFGGVGLSGTGFKAGGPHYLLRFLNEKCYTVNTAAARGVSEILSD